MLQDMAVKNGVKTGRKPSPIVLTNIGESIWSPFDDKFVNYNRFYKLQKQGIHLNELARNSWINHPDFKGQLKSDHWMDTTIAKLGFDPRVDTATSNTESEKNTDSKEIQHLKNEMELIKEEMDTLKNDIKIVYDGAKKLVSDLSKIVDWPF